MSKRRADKYGRSDLERGQDYRSCWDCDRMWTGRDRDNRAPTQAAAWQGRSPAPLPRDESRLQSGREQVGTQLEAHPIAADMQPEAVRGGHEDAREAPIWVGPFGER